MDFLELLQKHAVANRQKPALIFQEKVITFEQLHETAMKAANGLAGLGVFKQDKIAIYLPNTPEYIISFFAVFSLRAVCVPLDFMLTEEEVINFLNHSESKVLIAQSKKGIDFARIKDSCRNLQTIILLEEAGPGEVLPAGTTSWSRIIGAKVLPPRAAIEDSDIAAIFYTSGSTGHPKGVLLSYPHLKKPIETIDYFLHPKDSDIYLCPGVPFSHLGGLDYVLFMLAFGSTLVLLERFHPLEFLKAVEKYKVSIFCIVPSMYVAVLSLKEYDKFDLTSLRYAVVFGAPSSPELLGRFHKSCPNAYLLNGWGMTETSAPNSFLPTGTNTKEIANTGKFPPGTEARIVDDHGNALPDGSQGELWIKSRSVMVGYYKEPELTRQVLTDDGWLMTGDIAHRDNQGRYSIVGRKKDMIKVAGEIVFPAEVEEVLLRHPKVREAAVIAIADKMRGEIPKAFIVAKDNETLDDDQLRSFLRQHLAHFKIPHVFEFAPVLPKNRVGKIDKEKLKNPL